MDSATALFRALYALGCWGLLMGTAAFGGVSVVLTLRALGFSLGVPTAGVVAAACMVGVVLADPQIAVLPGGVGCPG